MSMQINIVTAAELRVTRLLFFRSYLALRTLLQLIVGDGWRHWLTASGDGI